MSSDVPQPARSSAPERSGSLLIRDPRELADLAREVQEAGYLALDTEFIREHTYRPRLCLVQIATPERVVIVDPFLVVGPALAPLLDLVLDPRIEKIVHAGEQDMEIFYGLNRQPPRNVFDVQVAAALAGHGESISYGKLVEAVLGHKLKKGETYTDWARRPLAPEQIEYALADVEHLHAIRTHLLGEIERRGRAEWLREELAFYEDSAHYERDPAEAYKRVRSARRLDPREVAVLRELAAWREEEAERKDWPRGRILSDESLVELARRAPRTLEALGRLRGLHPQLLKRSGAEILRRVEKARGLAAAELPVAAERRTDDPEIDLVVDLLEVVLRARAAEVDVAPGYLSSRKDLAELARRSLRGGLQPSAAAGDGPEESPGNEKQLPILSGWRRKLAGDALLQLLEGRSHVAIDTARSRVEVVER